MISIRPGLEPQQVGEKKRRHAEHRVGDDVEGDEQAVVAPYHRWPIGALSVSFTTRWISVTKRLREKPSACLRIRAASQWMLAARVTAAARESTVGVRE